MKKIYVIVAVALAILSCSKDNAPYSNTKEIKDFPTIEVLCDLDSPSVEMSSSPETRIAGSVEDPVNYPGRHSIIWKAGDQISQFSVVSANGSTALNVGDVLNFSNLPCTLKNGDGTTTFTMTIPNLQELYGATSGLNTYLCAIYPATTFSSITTTVDGSKTQPFICAMKAPIYFLQRCANTSKARVLRLSPRCTPAQMSRMSGEAPVKPVRPLFLYSMSLISLGLILALSIR